jgi:hypoxia up-regulated 1
LLGRFYDDPASAEYRKVYRNGMIKDPERGTCSFKITDEVTYTVEELMAMQLAHAKEQAEIYGGESVSGAVITVIDTT